MRKIFYEDINKIEFEGKVISCEYDDSKKLYKILLDATAFFPEEGGQSADLGTINDEEVLDVQIEDDLIYHYMKNPKTVDSTIYGKVDWRQRFDFMQQHSGEHILSGLIHNKFGYNNVGFHLSNNEVTMDFDGVLSLEQAEEIELLANKIIYDNLPIEVSYPDKSTLENLDYRSKIEIDGQVRIVTIPGVDVCACCAPHVACTGQIGIIKITSVQSYKGGVRLNILCGERAFKDYSQKFSNVSKIAQDLSIKQEKIVEGYERIKEECQSLKAQVNQLQNLCLNMSLNTLPLPSESSNAILFTDITDNVAMRNTVNDLMEKYAGYSAVFAENGTDDTPGSNTYRFIVGSKSLDCNELAKKLRTELGAKCGGNQLMIQGSVVGDRDAIVELFK